MNHHDNIAKLRRLSTILRPGDPLATILNEILAVAPKVEKTIDAGQAWCVPKYSKTGELTYVISYPYDKLHKIVHELTHAVVNEAYRQDFVDYPNSAANPPPLDLKENGTQKPENSEARRKAFRDEKLELPLASVISALRAAVQSAQLTMPRHIQFINNQLMYAQMGIYVDYDTVLNQLLFYMFDEGYPIKHEKHSKRHPSTALYEQLQQAAMNAYRSREKGRRQNAPKPLPAPVQSEPTGDASAPVAPPSSSNSNSSPSNESLISAHPDDPPSVVPPRAGGVQNLIARWEVLAKQTQ